MRLFGKKNQLERMLDSLDLPSDLKFDMPSGAPGNALKAGLIAAGGLVGLTAGSAAISSRRRQREGVGRGS